MGYWLQKAREIGFDNNDVVRKANTLRQKLQEEEHTLRILQDAVEARSLSGLAECISKCEDLRIGTPEVRRARELRGQLKIENQVKERLKNAVELRDIAML